MAFGYRYRLERQENGWWLVRFPGIPEALTEGETQAEARFPEPPQNLEPVRLLHVQVEQDEVGLEVPEGALCLRGVRDAFNDGVLSSKESPEHLDVVLAVVDDQHSAAHRLVPWPRRIEPSLTSTRTPGRWSAAAKKPSHLIL